MELALRLSKRIDVESITHDKKYEVAPMEDVTSEISSIHQNPPVEWNIEWVKAHEVWKKNHTGKGIIVGVVDTGVNFLHPAVVQHYVGRNANGTFNHDFNWFDPANRMAEPRDTQDHGTHCTGTVLGSTADKRYIIGAAHDAKWIHCHFGGSFQAIARCFQFMLAPHDRQGNHPNPALRPHVTSHSYGGGANGRSQLENVVNPLIDAGVHVVVAAHNYARCRAVTDPGIIPRVLTVGALGDKTNLIASFSSRGPNNAFYNNTLKPEISAPGTNIMSASGNGMIYVRKSGTSMATPLVAGVIALLWDAVPALNRNIQKTNEVLYESALKQESTDCESRGTPNNVYGHGTINAFRAYEIAHKLYGNK